MPHDEASASGAVRAISPACGPFAPREPPGISARALGRVPSAGLR